MNSPASALPSPFEPPRSQAREANAAIRRVVLLLPLVAVSCVLHGAFVMQFGHFMGPHGPDELPPSALWTATAILAAVIGVSLLSAYRPVRRLGAQLDPDDFGVGRVRFARILFGVVCAASCAAFFVSFSLTALLGDGGRLALPFLWLVE